MNMKITAVWSIVLTLCSTYMIAQDADDLKKALEQKVVGIGKRYADSAVIRWSPSNAALWRMAKTSGYKIERAELSNGKAGAFTTVSSPAVMPWTPQEWAAFLETNQFADTTEAQVVMIAAAMSEQSSEASDFPANDPEQIDSLRVNANRFEMNFNFALIAAERSRIAANGLGLRYVDRTVQRGTAYQYRVTLLGNTAPYSVASAIIDVSAKPNTYTAQSKAINAKELDGTVLLQWANTQGYSTFNVYRSTDGKQFDKLTLTPILTLKNGESEIDADGYLDTSLTNYNVYYYRVAGNNAFAEEEEVGTIKAMPRDRTAPLIPSGVRTEHVGVRHVKITWEMLEPVERDLAGFRVTRDTVDEGVEEGTGQGSGKGAAVRALHNNVLPATAREYTDTSAVLGNTYYYRVEAIDTARNVSRSYSVYVAFSDSIPPSPAFLVKGTMDTNGVVRITVRHPNDKDLMGYRVMMANDAEHEFTVASEMFNEDSLFNRLDTVFTDTAEVRTLTKNLYYKFIALDYHYNESENSNTLVIPRPDVIPPVAPVITDYHITDSSIVIEYVPSSSRDVRNHVILRRPFNEKSADVTDGVAVDSSAIIPWDSIGRPGIRESVLEDQSPPLSKKYEYALIAIDSSGLRSPRSNIVTLSRVDNGVRPAVTNVSAVYDTTSKTVRLRWVYQPLDEKLAFVIYKSTGGALQSYMLVKDQNLREFLDKQSLAPGTKYAVKVLTESGAESRLSEGVEVRR